MPVCRRKMVLKVSESIQSVSQVKQAWLPFDRWDLPVPSTRLMTADEAASTLHSRICMGGVVGGRESRPPWVHAEDC